MSTVLEEQEKRRKEHEERNRQKKLDQARIVANLKKLTPGTTWKLDRYSGFTVSHDGGTVSVVFKDEMHHGGFHVATTGRFNISVEPSLGSYSLNSAAATLFRARKEGWTDQRVREIAAKITLGLARSAEAHKHISAATATALAAAARIKNEKLHDENDESCSVFVRHDTGAYSVQYRLSLPKLTLDQAIAVAKFVNTLVKEPA